MADELLFLDELVAKWPDNTQGLIVAQGGREGWVSIAPALGAAYDQTGAAIPAGTDVDVNSLLALTYLGGQGISINGNGHFYHAYGGSITVPTDYTRPTLLMAQFSFESSDNTLTTFGFSDSGVALRYTEISIEWSAQTVAMPITLMGWASGNCNPADTFSMYQTKATGTGTITNFQMWAQSFVGATLLAAGDYFQAINWEGS